MEIAIFASKSFQVSSNRLYTFDEFSTGCSIDTETQDAAGGKPSTYIKGPGLDSMQFNIPLKTSMGINVRDEYESWKDIMEKSAAYPFILGGKPLGRNKWLLKKVDLSNLEFDFRGNILSGSLQLQFDEYVRPGSSQSGNPFAKDNSPKAISGGGTDVAEDLEIEKIRYKRENSNVSTAVQTGKGG